MSYYVPTPLDLALVHQNSQRRLIMVEVLNRTFQKISVITGDCIDFNSSVDAESNIRRICSLSILVNDMTYVSNDNISPKTISIDKYIRIYQGIYNEATNLLNWYDVGVFCIGENSYTYNETTRTLELSCQDIMAELTGDRRGYTYQQSPFIEKDLNISSVIVNILENMAGITRYDIAEVGGLIDGEFSPKTPFLIQFSTGVTMYEMLEKLITIHPQWEMFFDVTGKFIVQEKVLEENNDAVMLDDKTLSSLLIEENRSNSYANIFNCTVVYGKDGQFEAIVKDETIGSPYDVNMIGEIWHEPYVNEEIEDVDTSERWAKYYNYMTTRLYDTVTLKVLNMPFINDVNFKISYRSKADNKLRYYIVKKVTNNYSDNTTVLDCIQFYNENTSAYQPTLATPTITASASGLVLSVIINPVDGANIYKVYANYALIGTTTSTSFTYTFPVDKLGVYSITAKATADTYRDSSRSNVVSVEITDVDKMITDSGDYIITDSGDYIITSEE